MGCLRRGSIGLLRKWLAVCRIPSSPRTARPATATTFPSSKRSSRSLKCWTGPLTGRVFFEQVIRENLDVGRPDQVQLIFNRRVTTQQPGIASVPA